MKTEERGQGAIEAIVALPLLIALVAGLGVIFARGILRLELQTLTQELKVCYASTHPIDRCRGRYQQSLRRLPGGFRLVRVEDDERKFTAVLRHNLPLPPRQWSLSVPR